MSYLYISYKTNTIVRSVISNIRIQICLYADAYDPTYDSYRDIPRHV